MRKQEALAAQVTFQAARNAGIWWQRTALVVAGGFVGYLVDKWPGAAIGAGAGAATDAGFEIASLIKLKL